MRKCLLEDVEDGYYRPVRFRSNQLIAVLFSVTFITLFIGFHIALYDITIYQMQIQQYQPTLNQQDFFFINELSTANSSMDEIRNGTAIRKKLHFSKTKRRLPQVILFNFLFEFLM